MMKRLKIAVLLSGGGTTLQNLIDCRAAGTLPADIDIVVSSNEKAGGLERARRAGIETAVVASKKFRGADGQTDWASMSAEINAILLPRTLDLVCLAGFMCFYVIPPELQGKVLNIHPALLPAFGGRGMWGHHVHEAVRAAGVKLSGCTVHFVTNEYDAGPIILQRACPITAADSAAAIAARVFVEECAAYPAAIRLIAEERVSLQDGVVHIADAENKTDNADAAKQTADR